MGSTVLLGITGGIAAYKTPLLVRLLVQEGIEVHVVMTRAATHFVTPLTLATVSGNPVHEDMWSDRGEPSVAHIELADRANLAIIAPATANTIGKIASGIADNMLTTIFMAVRSPVLLCPSMNVNMYRHAIFQQNLTKLRELGYHLMDPGEGYLACGWTGEGRMPEPADIVERIRSLLAPRDLEGERVLVTAGPTEEPLDPARVITNRSSGRMGVAVARRASERGAHVTLVAGPLQVSPPCGVKHIAVKTAREMHDRVMDEFPQSDVVIKAAAVADFRPATAKATKLKKDDMSTTIRLVKNPDILHELGKRKQQGQILVGFAAETHDVLKNGRAKLKKKNLDLLVLNDVTKPGAGFDCDTNIVLFLHRSGQEEQMDLMTKDKVADHILDRVLALRKQIPRGSH